MGPTSQLSGEAYGVTWFAVIPRPPEAPPEAPVIDHTQCCYHAAGLCPVMREIASAKPGDPPNAVALRQCEMREPGGALKHATPVFLHHMCQGVYESTRNAAGFEFPVLEPILSVFSF